MFKNTNEFPLSFDYVFYKKDKPYLKSKEDAYDHFLSTGKLKGCKASPCCDPAYFINFLLSLRPESVLEIGPGCSPKMKGDNVYYFDVKSKEELQDRYKDDPGYKNIPQKIHYVERNGNLRSIENKFDIIFSSHMIEHSLDLIEHINSVESLLNENGLYCLIVPDKNYTFDYFKPVSLVEDAISQHINTEGNLSLLLRNILLEKTRRAHNIQKRHWIGDHGEVSFNEQDILNVIKNFENITNNPVAVSGFHNWFFTDDSFAEIMSKLFQLKMISLKLYESYNTPYGSCSFNAIMGR